MLAAVENTSASCRGRESQSTLALAEADHQETRQILCEGRWGISYLTRSTELPQHHRTTLPHRRTTGARHASACRAKASRPAASSLEGPTRKEKPGLERRPSSKWVRSKRMRLGVSSSSCTVSRPLLSVKPPDICVLRLPGGVAGRLKAGDCSESAGGASSGVGASSSRSGGGSLSILSVRQVCSTGELRSTVEVLGAKRGGHFVSKPAGWQSGNVGSKSY